MYNYIRVVKKTIVVVLAIQATILAEAAALYTANAAYEAYLDSKAATEVYNIDPGQLKTEVGKKSVKFCGDVYNGPETRAEQISITACQQAVADADDFIAKTFATQNSVAFKDIEANAVNTLKNTVDDRTKYTVKYMGHSINPFAQIGAAAVKEYYAQGYMKGVSILIQIGKQTEARKG